MKKFTYILFSLFVSLAASAQQKDGNTLKEWNILKHNKAYYWGQGTAANEAEADKAALANLISQISVNVSEEIKIHEQQGSKNGILDEKSQFESSVKTYSSQTLNNTKRFGPFGKAPLITVGRAIMISEIKNLFKQRENRARDMLNSAVRAEKRGHFDDALKNYYWALTLLKSVQYPDTVTYRDATGKYVMTVWLKEHINDILSDVKFNCVTRDGDDVDLRITYKDKPVNSVAFTYYDGRNWSRITEASDGYAQMELVPGYNAGSYKVRVEYQFKTAAKEDKELESVIGAVNGSEFAHYEKEIKGIKASKTAEVVQSKEPEALKALAAKGTFTTTNAKVIKAPDEVANKTEYLSMVAAIEQAIRKKQADDDIKQYFTSDGWDIYTRLIKYGSAKIVGVPSYTFFQNGDDVMARGMQMSFSFKNGAKKSFVEEVIYTFDKNNKIDNIAFGLGKTSEDDILNKNITAWTREQRLTIMNFLENYKTAYALKRYDYIKDLFDDNAIIITGKVVKKQSVGTERNTKQLGGDKITYNRQTKDQYLKNLKACFDSQEFINIHFAETDVKKGGKERGEAYGIQLEQDYYSATYGDHGYLFLYVDFNDPLTPLIKVRYWQPTKDSSLGKTGLFGLQDVH